LIIQYIDFDLTVDIIFQAPRKIDEAPQDHHGIRLPNFLEKHKAEECFVSALCESKLELAPQLQQLNIKGYLKRTVFLNLVSNRMHEKCGFEAIKWANPKAWILPYIPSCDNLIIC
jgi:hypothetical protein